MHDQLTLRAFMPPVQGALSRPARPGCPVVAQWTGREVPALRLANEEFAGLLARGDRW